MNWLLAGRGKRHAKLLRITTCVAAIVLLVPGFALLKEWAYAGVTFALVMATISEYVSEGAGKSILPLVLLAPVAVSYVTRPPNRRLVGGILSSGNSSSALPGS